MTAVQLAEKIGHALRCASFVERAEDMPTEPGALDVRMKDGGHFTVLVLERV